MTRRAWRLPLLRVHAVLEVCPALLGDLDVTLRELASVLAKHVQEDDQIPRAPIQDPVELTSVVAAQFTKLAFDLRGVRERQVRVRRRAS